MFFFILPLFSVALAAFPVFARAEPRPIPVPLYGVTVDSVGNWRGIVDSLKALPRVPTVRVVFDGDQYPGAYRFAVSQFREVGYVMGELLDSSGMKVISQGDFEKRVDYYLNMLGNDVDLWEIGNEVNGEWLGPTGDVVAKVSYAQEAVKAHGGKTALTLYYNQGCLPDTAHEMFTWADANLSAELKAGLDYVFVSYYEQDCNYLRPDWPAVFHRLGEMFPKARIGFGEVGAKKKSEKAELLNRYYSLKIDEPRFVGGYFWWYFLQDMVPASKPLFETLRDAWILGTATPPILAPAPPPTSPPSSPDVSTPPPTSPATPPGVPSPTPAVPVKKHGWFWRLFHRHR